MAHRRAAILPPMSSDRPTASAAGDSAAVSNVELLERAEDLFRRVQQLKEHL
jgi:hypothetical protein